MKIIRHTADNGLTVAELKELIKDWPETDHMGEPTEVWVETCWQLSSPVVEISPLNMREIDGVTWADIIFSSSAFQEKDLETISS